MKFEKKKVWVIGLSVQPVDCSSNEIAMHGLKTTLFMKKKKKNHNLSGDEKNINERPIFIIGSFLGHLF